MTSTTRAAAPTVGRRRVPLAATGALLMAVALAGCAAGANKPIDEYPGEPKGVEAPASSAGGAAYAVWLENGQQFAVTLYGSSSCPPKIASVAKVASNQLKVTLQPAPGGVCTRDYVPYTSVFTTPGGITTTSDVTVKLPDSTLTLPGQSG